MRIFSARNRTKDLLFVGLAALVLGADQLTKYLVRTYMDVGESIPQDGIIRLTYIQNTGSAFGLFPNQTWILTIAAIIGVALIGYFYIKSSAPSTLLGLSLILQLGGAVGNIIDRVAYGHVIDFVDLGVWPIFNLADSSITIGFVVLTWALLTRKDKRGSRGDASIK